MRSSEPKGRFTIDYEVSSIREGIAQDLQRPAGQFLVWHRFDENLTAVDSIYDVGSSTTGRQWKFPGITVPAVSAVVMQGQTFQDERGFYQADFARVVLNVRDVDERLPGLRDRPDPYIKDRVVYQGTVFEPTRLYLRGHISQFYTVLTLDLRQVNPEEIVNDSQWRDFAN